MREPREVGRFANFYYRMREDGSVQWRHVADKDDPEGISWHREAENNAAIIREVARLQEENAALRDEITVLRAEIDEHRDAAATAEFGR